MCRIVTGLELRMFEGGDSLQIADYVFDWGKIDWLDCADGGLIGCLEAGEVMELLMMSDSFGSGEVHNEENSIITTRDVQEDPEHQVERDDSGVNQTFEAGGLLSNHLPKNDAPRASGSATDEM